MSSAEIFPSMLSVNLDKRLLTLKGLKISMVRVQVTKIHLYDDLDC